MKTIYVLSHAFSGSTLMAFLLGAHPDVATIGEITVTSGIDVKTYPCSCGTVIHECPFWVDVSRRMAEANLDYDVFQPRMRFRGERWLADRVLRAGVRGEGLESLRSAAMKWSPAVRSEADELLHRNETFARAVVAARGRAVFLDISKHPNRLLHLLRSRELDIHVVYLVRDPRKVAYSCRKNLGMSVEDGARSWASFAEECENVRRYVDDDRWTLLRHEDLCADPDREMERLHAFAGLRPDASYRDFRAAEHHIIGNRMRLGSSSEIREDDKWVDALAEAEKAEVLRITESARRLAGVS